MILFLFSVLVWTRGKLVPTDNDDDDDDDDDGDGDYEDNDDDDDHEKIIIKLEIRTLCIIFLWTHDVASPRGCVSCPCGFCPNLDTCD